MSEFVDDLKDVFWQFGSVSARRMFGGYGVYHDGLMSGLVADDILYLKVDAESVGRFTELGLDPFEYEKNGRNTAAHQALAPLRMQAAEVDLISYEADS